MLNSTKQHQQHQIKNYPKMDYYDIDKIINYASTDGVDISPADRQEWALLCCALKVLGYGLNTFVSISNCTAAECEKVWKAEKNPARYVPTEDKAKAKIVGLAKAAGIDLKPFKTSTAPKGQTAPNSTKQHQQHQTAPTAPNSTNAAADFEGIELPELPPVYIAPEEVKRRETDTEKTALFNFLCRLFPVDEVRRVFRLYRVGATKEFSTAVPALASAFPYLNAGGQCVDIHLMPYEADGHRRKSGYNQNWLLAKRKQSDRRAVWPLFGEHLLPLNPSAPVGIVESEKTALIAAICAPGYVWTATGSLNNLNARRCAALDGRECYVFPDADGLERWREKATALHASGFSVYFCGEYITDHAQAPKDDLGDILCRYCSTLDDAAL